MRRKSDEDEVPASEGSAGVVGQHKQITQMLEYMTVKERALNKRYIECLVLASRMASALDREAIEGGFGDKTKARWRMAHKALADFKEWDKLNNK